MPDLEFDGYHSMELCPLGVWDELASSILLFNYCPRHLVWLRWDSGCWETLLKCV